MGTLQSDAHGNLKSRRTIWARERERLGAINMLVGTEATGINEIIREKTWFEERRRPGTNTRGLSALE